MLGPDFNDPKIRKEKLKNLENGLYDDLFINIDVPVISEENKYASLEDYFSMLPQIVPKQGLVPIHQSKPNEKFSGKLSDARNVLQNSFLHNLSEKIDIKKKAIADIESEAIIFIDEIDKIAVASVDFDHEDRQGGGRNPSSEGVQRDLLPLIEGTTITTKNGDVNTTNILFICAGAFSISKPTDIMPELLGRLPNRIQLQPLTKKDFKKILTGVENNLVFQYQKLMQTEGISLTFTDDAIDLICSSRIFSSVCEEQNLSTDNLGARRLPAVIEKITEKISFQGPDSSEKEYLINREFVLRELKDHFAKADLRRYML